MDVLADLDVDLLAAELEVEQGFMPDGFGPDGFITEAQVDAHSIAY